MFFTQLRSGRDIGAVPSALIGAPAPQTNLPPIDGLALPALNQRRFRRQGHAGESSGRRGAPVRQEHPVLMALAQDKRFQDRRTELQGRAGKRPAVPRRPRQSFMRWWAPTRRPHRHRLGRLWRAGDFIVGRDGRILYKHVGPLDGEQCAKLLLPEIEKALAAGR